MNPVGRVSWMFSCSAFVPSSSKPPPGSMKRVGAPGRLGRVALSKQQASFYRSILVLLISTSSINSIGFLSMDSRHFEQTVAQKIGKCHTDSYFWLFDNKNSANLADTLKSASEKYHLEHLSMINVINIKFVFLSGRRKIAKRTKPSSIK